MDLKAKHVGYAAPYIWLALLMPSVINSSTTALSLAQLSGQIRAGLRDKMQIHGDNHG